ncbi:ATP-binding protein [Streptomyces sp. SID5473]|uniref:ATP-binding protein n=2 Tax=Streptomyces TaxID=1883 RepID=A0A7G3U8U5_STRT9|nr:ATP-binding protein [Streptomyces sp. SID5473]QKM66766.1 ATP-binding protein [Streptomyces tsukubensis NRRL18488]TAI45508.1 ATP-binding protein [Streptomyces tsukubensis]
MTGRQGWAGSSADGHGRYGGVPGQTWGREQLHRRMGCGDLESVPEVRHGLREMLGQWGSRGTADVAELLASELVTNALIHTDHGAVVTATVGSETLRVEVRDFVEGFPEPPVTRSEARQEADLLDTHGRGLALVQSLADSWGVRTQRAGKVVWFELNALP